MRVLFPSFVAGVLALNCGGQTVEPAAQWGEVLFDNAVLAGHPEVTDPLVRADDGWPLVGTNFIAELYYGTSSFNMIRLSNAPPARFRPEHALHAGTWMGDMRTLVGIPPGTQTYMQVVIWNNDAAQTVEQTRRNNGPYLLFSQVFTYVPPPAGSPIEAHYMKNFEGLGGQCNLMGARPPASILVQPTNQTVRVGDDVVISVLSTNFCYHQWQFNGTMINRLPGSRFLVITNVQPSQAGDYRVIIDAIYPMSGGLTSQVARLTVLTPPHLTAARYEEGSFVFQVSEDSGRPVVIETAPDLNPGSFWSRVFTNTAPFWFTNSSPADRQRFYRTVVE